MVKEVTTGTAQKSDLDVTKDVGSWPLLGDAVPWIPIAYRAYSGF